MRAVPADGGRTFLRVNLLPMILYGHTDQRLCIGTLFLNHNATHYETATKLLDVNSIGVLPGECGGPTQELVMPFYRDNVYPHLVDIFGKSKAHPGDSAAHSPSGGRKCPGDWRGSWCELRSL